MQNFSIYVSHASVEVLWTLDSKKKVGFWGFGVNGRSPSYTSELQKKFWQKIEKKFEKHVTL